MTAWSGVQTSFEKIFTYVERIDNQAECDFNEIISDELLHPARIAFGSKWIRNSNTGFDETIISKVDRVFAGIILILLSPVLIPTTLLGAILVLNSASHDIVCRGTEIDNVNPETIQSSEKKLTEIMLIKKGTDEELKKINDVLIEIKMSQNEKKPDGIPVFPLYLKINGDGTIVTTSDKGQRASMSDIIKFGSLCLYNYSDARYLNSMKEVITNFEEIFKNFKNKKRNFFQRCIFSVSNSYQQLKEISEFKNETLTFFSSFNFLTDSDINKITAIPTGTQDSIVLSTEKDPSETFTERSFESQDEFNKKTDQQYLIDLGAYFSSLEGCNPAEITGKINENNIELFSTRIKEFYRLIEEGYSIIIDNNEPNKEHLREIQQKLLLQPTAIGIELQNKLINYSKVNQLLYYGKNNYIYSDEQEKWFDEFKKNIHQDYTFTCQNGDETLDIKIPLEAALQLDIVKNSKKMLDDKNKFEIHDLMTEDIKKSQSLFSAILIDFFHFGNTSRYALGLKDSNNDGEILSKYQSFLDAIEISKSFLMPQILIDKYVNKLLFYSERLMEEVLDQEDVDLKIKIGHLINLNNNLNLADPEKNNTLFQNKKLLEWLINEVSSENFNPDLLDDKILPISDLRIDSLNIKNNNFISNCIQLFPSVSHIELILRKNKDRDFLNQLEGFSIKSLYIELGPEPDATNLLENVTIPMMSSLEKLHIKSPSVLRVCASKKPTMFSEIEKGINLKSLSLDFPQFTHMKWLSLTGFSQLETLGIGFCDFSSYKSNTISEMVSKITSLDSLKYIKMGDIQLSLQELEKFGQMEKLIEISFSKELHGVEYNNIFKINVLKIAEKYKKIKLSDSQ